MPPFFLPLQKFLTKPVFLNGLNYLISTLYVRNSKPTYFNRDPKLGKKKKGKNTRTIFTRYCLNYLHLIIRMTGEHLQHMDFNLKSS